MATNLLSKTLGFTPLDRLQVSDKREIRELFFGAPSHNHQPELPFLYFQCVRPDGMLEVCSPGGYAMAVSPHDVCDVLPGKPLIVRAIPEKVFLSRLRLSIAERQARPGPECYAEAYVLRVTKDRWNRVDQTFVWFLDPALNGDHPKAATIHDEDRRLVENHARRTNMPVMSLAKGNASADQGVAQAQSLNHDIAARFLRECRKGNRAAAEVLSMAGYKKITRAGLNQIGMEKIAA